MTVETLPFRPRRGPRPLSVDTARDIVAVVHRRAGKTAGLMWRGLRRALTIPRQYPPPRVIHTLPYQVQWDRTGLWDELARAARGIPGARVLKSDMRVVLPNGGVYQAGGMDRPDSWRGGYADEIIIDEYDDTVAEGQVTAILPMLSDHNGTLVRSGTPKGLGQLKAAYDRARDDPTASVYLLRHQDTGILDADVIERMRASMSEEEFAQEYECSFDAPHSGAFWAHHIRIAEVEGRIRTVNYDPAVPVYTAWDIGHHDDTAIWWYQVVGLEIHVIDYWGASGSTPEYVAELVGSRGYRYAKHYLPHDGRAKTFASGGRSVLEQLAALMGGIGMFAIVPDIGVQDGIQAVRTMLPLCWFDEELTRPGVNALRNYRRRYNTDTGAYMLTPLHDWSSHAADAFRMMAVMWSPENKPIAQNKDAVLMVGSQNQATLNDMWKINAESQKRGRV